MCDSFRQARGIIERGLLTTTSFEQGDEPRNRERSKRYDAAWQQARRRKSRRVLVEPAATAHRLRPIQTDTGMRSDCQIRMQFLPDSLAA